MCSVQCVTEEEGSPRDVVDSVQEGQGKSVDAVVDRLVEGGVPRGGVEREVNVGGVRPRGRKGRPGSGG